MSEFEPNEFNPPKIDVQASPAGINSTYQRKQVSGKGTASLVFAILSLIALAASPLGLFANSAGWLAYCGPLAALLGMVAIVFGGLGIGDVKRSGENIVGMTRSLAGAIMGGLSFLASAVPVLILIFVTLEARSQTTSSNNLKRIGMAFHNHHDVYGDLPPAGVNEDEMEQFAERTTKRFNVQLSWRVHVLPFLDDGVYRNVNKELKSDEPWDGPHNSTILKDVPKYFRSPSYDESEGNTVYLAVVRSDLSLPATALERGRTTRFAHFTDGTSNTILVVEANAEEAKPWAKPGDLEFDPKNPRNGLGELRPGGFLALLANGGVRFIPNSIDDDVLRHLIQRNDGHDVDLRDVER